VGLGHRAVSHAGGVASSAGQVLCVKNPLKVFFTLAHTFIVAQALADIWQELSHGCEANTHTLLLDQECSWKEAFLDFPRRTCESLSVEALVLPSRAVVSTDAFKKQVGRAYKLPTFFAMSVPIVG